SPDLKGFPAMARTVYPHDRAIFLDETPYPCSHPALKARKGSSLVRERLQEDRLRHPDGIGILGDNVIEGKLAGDSAIDTDEPLVQGRMGLRQDVLQQPQLVEQMRRTRLQDFAAKLALEGLMAFQDHDVHVTFGQQQTKQQPRWPTAHNTDAGLDTRHTPISCSDVRRISGGSRHSDPML